jgi:osmotically inducible protein OsmC
MTEHKIDVTRTAQAIWMRGVPQGSGKVQLGSGAFEGDYSFTSRMADGAGTNPEELLGAAHAACFSMALSLGLTQAGHPPSSISTVAKVHFGQTEAGFAISKIELETEGVVPGVDDSTFQQAAAAAKSGCPISKALAAVDITLQAKLQPA